ncbi:class II fructose-bisphosphatase [Culicoidibacter larvae]|uniref:Fructose-1,6-bisphosphatase n=1 Tax=Culicoidibacter larvae TaxID=2579976 RepID=A0A5R8QCE9_9FIRM|nr:class II fructose-bisphosphatase [Culicoidibacter larvae]TLG74178.1 class II fructose-bisphosphatase [Culicoidibacter larvae]
MRRELAIEFSRVTEAAALASSSWIGRGDKLAADEAAVEAMRLSLNETDIDGTIVIGEGEIDEAPMLYIGERLGTGNGEAVEIAVDPIDGTRMVAMGQPNAVAVMAVADPGVLLKAPDMYMEKLVVAPGAKGKIDLNDTLEENIIRCAEAIGKPLSEFVVMTLAKPRHEAIIARLHDLGVRVHAIPDGDVAASVFVCMPEREADMFYGIGGAPEGVISAAVVRALDGDMQGRLLPRYEVKGDTKEHRIIGADETRRCHEMGLATHAILKLEDMVSNDNIIFSATGITDGDLLHGVRRAKDDILYTETLVIRGKSRTVRRIESAHYLRRKADNLLAIINK